MTTGIPDNPTPTARLLAVGDVISARTDGGFEGLGNLVRSEDIFFFNCETPYAKTGTPAGMPHGTLFHDPLALPNIVNAGFNVCTLANNHIMDWGTDAVIECRDRLEEVGIAVCGAGRNTVEAHKPAIVERQGVRFGFLGYCCTGPEPVRAEEESAGAATVRAYTAYQPVDYYPGSPRIEISTWPHKSDAAQMTKDIELLAESADIVCVTFHWGTVYVPAVIPDYEAILGRMAIDAGADIILGHSPHILKGIEVYRGKPIVHSLNHLMIEGISTAKIDFLNDREGLRFANPDSRKSIILQCDFSLDGLQRLSYVPVMLNEDWTDPVMVSPRHREGQDIFDYVAKISDEAGFDTEFACDGDEVVVSHRGGWL